MKTFLRFLTTCFLFALFHSSIFAQDEIHVPFRKGELWGYADTNRNIIIPPVYTAVYQQKDGLFVVTQGKKFGVVNHLNQTIIDFKYSSIKIHDTHIRAHIHREGIYTFYKDGEPIIDSPLVTFHRFTQIENNCLIVKTKSNKSGLLELSSKLNKIEKWHLDTIYQDLLQGIKKEYSTEYNQFIFTHEDNFYLDLGDKYQKFYLDGTFKKIDISEFEYQKEIHLELRRNFGNSPASNIKYSVLLKNMPELDTATWSNHTLSTIDMLGSYQIVLEKRVLKKGYLKNIKRDTLLDLFKEVEFINIDNRLAKKMSTVHAQKQIVQYNWAIVKNHKNKRSIINGLNQTIFPFEFDSIMSKPIIYNDTLYFKVVKNKKWGIISQYGAVTVSFNYNTILEKPADYNPNYYRLYYGFIVKKDKKWGVINIKEEIFVPFDCDEVSPKHNKSWDSFQTKKDGKHGLYADGVYAKPLFNDKIYYLVNRDGYDLILMPNEKRRPLPDFTDLKGFPYFED